MKRTLEIVRGARAGEARLLASLAGHRNAMQDDPRKLGRPVRIIVPSGALRKHLNARVVAHFGACAGIEVRTLFATALEVLAFARGEDPDASEAAPNGQVLFELFARREARNEPSLREALDGLEAGYRAVVETIRDLFDAGFEPAHAEALSERLSGGGAGIERARALLAVAACVGNQLEERRTALPARFFAEAKRLTERGSHGQAFGALFIHGFADVTGRAGDFLEALFRRFPSTVILDESLDPCDPSRPDVGSVFSERLRQRLEGQAQEVSTIAPEPAAQLTFVRTSGPEAEARAVAERIRTLLNEGVQPESIAVCARELTSHKSELRSQFCALGIPFSAPGTAGLVDGPARAILALLESMHNGGRVNAQRWLDACARFVFERTLDGERKRVPLRPSPDLRLALRAAGAGRLQDVARLNVPALVDSHGTYRLPTRTGLHSGSDPRTDGPKEKAARRISGTYAPYRRFHGDDLKVVVAGAGRMLGKLHAWPERAGIGDHLKRFEDLRRCLGWRSNDPAEERIHGALEELGLAFAAETLERVEFLWLLERTLIPLVRPALQREGERATESGVQILDAMSARARTFEHLFLIGLNRDSFPRVVAEDPLLPDALRAAWSELLPDIPIKARGREEERYLFAQLVSSSPNVTLSWQTNDAEGKARVISPLIERLGIENRAVEEAQPLIPSRVVFEDRVHTAQEHAVLAGLIGGPRTLLPRLQLALEEAGLSQAARTADARVRALRAYEDKDPKSLLPWLGWLGPQDTAPTRPDPRREPLFITHIEHAVDCTWRLALSKILRLEEAPDPLERLPSIEPRTLGLLVHEVLERIAAASWDEETRPQDLERALAGEPRPTRWPSLKALEHLTGEVARELLDQKGSHEPGLRRLICHVALPLIERARSLFSEEASHHTSEEETSGCLGVELQGVAEAQLSDGQRMRVRFIADRVDRLGDRLILSDFKTGKQAVSEGEFLKKLSQGKILQPSAYVHGTTSTEKKVRARLLYLNPEVDEDRRSVLLEKESPAAETWIHALKPVRDAWHAGVFFPRLTDPTGERVHDSCRMCDVSAACLHGDSSARAKLVEMAHGDDATVELTAMRGLWEVARAKKKGEARR